MIPNVLSIAGSDPSGGAGIQADLKTFSALGAYGMCVITALTAQNTQGVSAIHNVPTEFVTLQLDMLFQDSQIAAVKIGMLSQTDIVLAVADVLRTYQPIFVVLDPVMVATSGDKLLDDDAISAVRQHLLPLANVITPNLPEAAVLLNQTPAQDWRGMQVTAQALQQYTNAAVLLKGGHLRYAENSNDLLRVKQREICLSAPRVDTLHTHGTGCTLSSAIAALLPQKVAVLAYEEAIIAAVQEAKTYLTKALQYGNDLQVGKGRGPVQHFYQYWEK